MRLLTLFEGEMSDSEDILIEFWRLNKLLLGK